MDSIGNSDSTMAADESKGNGTTIEHINHLISFLEALDDSNEKYDENVREFENLLKPLPPDQIDVHTDNWDRETILHVAARKGFVWAAKILLEANASISEHDYKQCQPLHIACESGQVPLVRFLLGREADIQAKGWNGWSPLHYASLAGRTEVARLLLELGANAYATDSSGDMPFHVAAACGHTDILKTFLKENVEPAIDVNVVGQWKMTALHRAAWSGRWESLEYLLGLDAKFNLKTDLSDEDGWTPLMAATKGGYLSSMSALLCARGYDQANIRDNEKKTPLFVAIEDENLEGVHILLDHMPDKDKRDTDVYQRLLSYEASNLEDGRQDMQTCIQQTILDALKKDRKAFDGALLWAAAKFERHKIAKTLLIRDLRTAEQQPLSESSVIELATQQQKLDILWWLVATSPSNPKIKANIKAAKDKAEKSEREAQEKPTKYVAEKPESWRKSKSKSGEDSGTYAARASGNESKVWRHVIDILQYPPIAQEYEDSAILDPPRLKSEHFKCVNEFEAVIAGFYNARHTSSIIQRTRGLKEIIYGQGPRSITAGAISNLKNTMDKRFEDKEEIPGSRRFRATYNDTNLKFTYIHLPATNIDWMKDLLLNIMVGEKNKNGSAKYRGVSSFLESTWLEIPDRTSASRFMRPRFMERIRIPSIDKKRNEGSPLKPNEDQKGTATDEVAEKQECLSTGTKINVLSPEEADKKEVLEEEEQDDNFIPSSALYMPFLSFATQEEYHQRSCEPNFDMPNKAEGQQSMLIQGYGGSVVHSSATLDEAYYHFDSDLPSVEERNRRNRNQVVTKQLDSKPKDPRRPREEPWPLLRVNQIWIWTINDKWIIGAASHQVDDIEQSWLDGFTEYLNKRIEAGGASSQPGSTEDMMKAIVNYCIGSYDRRRTFRGPNDEWKTGLSIRQLFSNYINYIGRGETDLFAVVQELQNETDTSQRKDKFKNATSKAKELFGEIKDTRDELGIIKSIVNYQINVQRKLFKEDPKDLGLASSHFLNDVTEMERIAGRIQDNVNSTLSLLQSEIANFQTEQSVKQGTNMMAFTSITAVFLPLSFLTSLFALDVESFEKAPVWAFKVIFGVSFPFAALVIYALYFHPYVMAKTKPIREYPKKQYEYIKKRYSEYIKLHTRHIKKRYSRAKDEEEGPEETSPPEVLRTGPSSNRVL